MRDLTTLDRSRLRDQERSIFGTEGDSKNGVFKIFVGKHSFFCIASVGLGWEHVSVSRCNGKCNPTWEEMCELKNKFFDPEERVVQFHPPKSEYVNSYPYCLHLWKPTDCEMPYPPKWMV